MTGRLPKRMPSWMSISIKEIEMTKFTNFHDDPTIKALYADESYEKNSEIDFDDLFHETTSYWINNIRRRKKFTQQHLADSMHISQPGICQMLKRPATIAKLFRLCAAMGGILEVNVRFGDEVISLLYGDEKPEETPTK